MSPFWKRMHPTIMICKLPMGRFTFEIYEDSLIGTSPRRTKVNNVFVLGASVSRLASCLIVYCHVWCCLHAISHQSSVVVWTFHIAMFLFYYCVHCCVCRYAGWCYCYCYAHRIFGRGWFAAPFWHWCACALFGLLRVALHKQHETPLHDSSFTQNSFSDGSPCQVTGTQNTKARSLLARAKRMWLDSYTGVLRVTAQRCAIFNIVLHATII